MVKSLEIEGESYFKIENVDGIRPFFMSIVSASNHWMFISSNGGLTAGRKNAEYSLFPYYTDDKITESAEITGSKSIFKVTQNDNTHFWEPFSVLSKGKFQLKRNLYKNKWGNKILFEEINETLGLVFRYQWSSSNLFGFLRTSSLENLTDQEKTVEIVDGIQNIVPHGVTNDIQNQRSNLVDAYKRSELEPKTGLGIFALSAIIVDKAEPSEALKANVVWSMGFDSPKHLLSSIQLENFRNNQSVIQEEDVKAEKGAYFISTEITLPPNAKKEWHIVADVNKNHAAVAGIISHIKNSKNLLELVKSDIEDGTQNLIRLTASADGMQKTADSLKDARHFANSMFNIMRGGIFDHNYQIEKWDFVKYFKTANNQVYLKHEERLESLPELFTLSDLEKLKQGTKDVAFHRLATEYLPLKFSRRHGDPSRPWNKFSINTINENDGSKILDYEGNWRDIFQNWEALAWSYPAFIEGMIYRFLNASTFDGYNPYRITKDGFDWEIIEPEDPWSYIGYWGDHQIIYLLKFLEFIEKYKPGKLNELFDKDAFVYAAVPYKIKPYEEIIKNTKDTIEFDHEWDAKIRKHRDELGSDGALLAARGYKVHQVNFMEKILATTLAKVSNFIPEAGIWMNTQRPEWNDANNALVGNGVSMVTLNYLRRFLTFFKDVFEKSTSENISISKEFVAYFRATNQTFEKFEGYLTSNFSDTLRKKVMDELGKSSSEYRELIYSEGFSGEKINLDLTEVKSFFELCNKFMEHAINANLRQDKLFHAYNIIDIKQEETSVSYLSEMLEGQVAALSSGFLTGQQAVDLLDNLRTSDLYREDQNSYVLYPFKELSGFLQKNQVPSEAIAKSGLLQKLIEDYNLQIIEKDVFGQYHFNGSLRNGFELEAALNNLDAEKYGLLLNEEKELVLGLYEQVFNHKEFTGRSGTFYGYEGLGSIYWHMVSKLLLAVQETTHQAIKAGESAEVINKLKHHYFEIFEGIGVHKSPEVYGAFSIDPYSHTPFWKGAQQPGMTGQVKEDVLSRFGELGISLENGLLAFSPKLLDFKTELLQEETEFTYMDVSGNSLTLHLNPNSLAFTYCQVPVIYSISNESKMALTYKDGSVETQKTLTCTLYQTHQILERNGEIVKVEVYLKN